MSKIKTDRATGCTLDYNNLRSLTHMWDSMIDVKKVAVLDVHVNDKNSETYKTLTQHDPNMLRLLRTWVQSSKIIQNELVERVAEINKIIAENPEEYAAYLKATGQQQPEQDGSNDEGEPQ